MLGQSMFVFGPPVAVAFAVFASRSAADRRLAIAALSVATLELLGLVLLLAAVAWGGGA